MEPVNVGEEIPGWDAVTFAEKQPEYTPLPALWERAPIGRVMSRWQLDDYERKAIADGADLFVTVMTFQHKLQPIQLVIGPTSEPRRAVWWKRLLGAFRRPADWPGFYGFGDKRIALNQATKDSHGPGL